MPDADLETPSSLSPLAAPRRLEDVLPPAVLLALAFALLVFDQILAVLLWFQHQRLAALLVSATVGVILPVVLVHRRLELPLRSSLGLERPRAADLARVAWMLAGLVPVDYAVTAMSRRWFPPDDAQFEIFEALIPAGVWNVVVGVLGVIVLVPLAEEILFRRLVFGALRRWVGGIGAVVASGILFGLAHGSAWMFLPIFIFGTLLGWLMLRTGSLSLTWLAHGCFNLVAYVELCVTRDPRSVRIETWASQPGVWLPSLALFVAWAIAEARAPRVVWDTPPAPLAHAVDGDAVGGDEAVDPAEFEPNNDPPRDHD